MRAYDIIYKKRNKEILSREEIEFMIFNYNNGEIPDYQMSAFLMSVFFNSMTDEETFILTNAMANSGDIMDLSFLGVPTADKHSTGGVGDGTSLILAPIVASAGVSVPMMSGRALGHTGGTLDKLESIPNFRTNLDNKEFLELLESIGVALIGQTQEIAPVDKKMYALRDVTATVESIPLICASIMSKKIAEGAQTLILDVKTGNGAFIKSYEQSKELAQKMIAVGKSFKRNVSAYITDMDTPLGNCAGNSLEIKQTIDILKGDLKNDLSELSIDLAAAMIFNSKKANSLEDAKKIALKQIETGAALEKFRDIIRLQGGNPKVIDSPDTILPQAKKSVEIKAVSDGFISQMRTRDIGIACMLVGAGRQKTDDKIDYSSGAYLYKKTGDFVKKDEVIAKIVYNAPDFVQEAKVMMEQAYLISQEKQIERKIIKEILN